MKSPKQNAVLIDYFLAMPLSTSVFQWLNFRIFCQQANTPEKLNLSIANTHAEPILHKWQLLSAAQPANISALLLMLVSSLFGASAMAGVLIVAAQQVVNIWLPLALFAFIPFVLTVLAAYSSLFSSARFSLERHLSLRMLLPKALANQAELHQPLLMAWLFWQLQRMAVSFLVAALMAFALFGIFQSFSFGWSSTFIKHSETFAELMQVISWPWHYWLPSPSLEFIQQTEIGQAHFNAQAAQNWWPNLVMAIVVYGLMPRWLLSAVLRYKFKQQLSYDIEHSSDLDQLINRLKQQPSLNTVTAEKPAASPLVLDLTANQLPIIAWQKEIEGASCVRVLGKSDWQTDEHWLNDFQPNTAGVLFAVTLDQTPTFELADSIELLKNKGIEGSLLITGQASDRFTTQLVSWQYFASQHGFSLFIEAQLYDQH